MPSEKSYIHYLSFLKCIGMFAVIGIHTFCTPSSSHEIFSQSGQFAAYFLTNSLRMWAVPVFVMVSGALFLNPERNLTLKKLYGKYILRFLLVLLTFGTLFALMEIVFDAKSFTPKMILTALLNVYSGKLWDHMWFVYMIIGLYAVAPIFQKMLSDFDDTLLKYFLIILFIFSCFVPFLNKVTGVQFGVYIPCASIWLFYYLLGYALHFEKIKISANFSILFIGLGILWCVFGQFFPEMRDPNGASLKCAGTNGILAVLMSAGIFSLAKDKCKKDADFIDTVINPLSFGVYIIHALFMNIFYKVLHISVRIQNIWLAWLIVFFGTAVGSLFAVWVLRKIPFVRKYIL